MNEQPQLAWLGHRCSFGLHPEERRRWETQGVDAIVEELVDPDAAGVADPGDPFADVDRAGPGGRVLRETVGRWLEHAKATPRPLVARMQFFWHDYFAVSGQVVREPGLLHDHFNLLERHALGNFAEMLRAVTIDPAMLVFLDGARSTGANPNENYGRELLELYSVGVGNHTEDDVRAAAVALTGWVVTRREGGEATFGARRHDDTLQTLLGVEAVHDLDTVIDAVVTNPATHRRVVTKLADALLGPGVDAATIDRHVASFGSDLELRPLVRGLIADGLTGAGSEAIIEPVPWFLSALASTGAQTSDRRIAPNLIAGGQVPFIPPNVGGFPAPSSYLSTSATVARFNLASAVAANTPSDAEVLGTAGADVDELAWLLGLPGAFSAETKSALLSVTDPVERLAAALAAPDLIVSAHPGGAR